MSFAAWVFTVSFVLAAVFAFRNRLLCGGGDGVRGKFVCVRSDQDMWPRYTPFATGVSAGAFVLTRMFAWSWGYFSCVAGKELIALLGYESLDGSGSRFCNPVCGSAFQGQVFVLVSSRVVS